MNRTELTRFMRAHVPHVDGNRAAFGRNRDKKGWHVYVGPAANGAYVGYSTDSLLTIALLYVKAPADQVVSMGNIVHIVTEG